MADSSPPHILQSEVPREPQTNEWSGPDDPDCPYNWPLWKRIYMTSIPVLLCVNVLALYSATPNIASDSCPQVFRLFRIHIGSQ